MKKLHEAKAKTQKQNQDRRQLREEIRAHAAKVFAVGSSTPGKIADHVMSAHAALVRRLGDQLSREAIVGMTRDELRKMEAITGASASQFELPIELRQHRFPPIISVPRDKEADAQDEQGEDVEWMPWRAATLAQGLRHLELLSDSIARDIVRRDAWRALCDFVSEKTDGDLDAIIGETLACEAVA